MRGLLFYNYSMKTKSKYRNRNAGDGHTYTAAKKRYFATKKQKKIRARNTKLRREAIRKGLHKVGDGKDVSHTKDGGWVMENAHANRSRNGRNGKSTKSSRRGRKSR